MRGYSIDIDDPTVIVHMAELGRPNIEEDALPPPCFPQPKFSTAHVEREVGIGHLLHSRSSGRRFFRPESSPCVQTQFSGSVSRCYEVWTDGQGWRDENIRSDDGDEEEPRIVQFGDRSFRFYLSRPLALKTCRIEELKLEAQWQQRKLGELTGEDPLKEVAALQLLQSHPNVEELQEVMIDDTNLYKITTWYEGGELFDLAPMPEESAKGVFAELLDALDFVHTRGVCHRDISLENILMDTRIPDRIGSCRSSSVSSIASCVSIASSAFSETHGPTSGYSYNGDGSPADSDIHGAHRGMMSECGPAGWIGRPRLCDFGMSIRIPKSAKGKRALLTPQGRCGKNTCVAPEVFHDQEFNGEAVDAWSLGTTLFMALLGVQPWEEIGDYKFQAIAEGQNLEVVLEGWNLRHLLSQDAVDLLQAMLTADPGERLSDIKSILAHPWFQRFNN